MSESMVIYYRKKCKILQHYYINSNTPVGEPPNFYEPKPYGGKRLISENEVLGFIVKDKFQIYHCLLTQTRLDIINTFCTKNNIPIDTKYLFHNGYVLTTIKNPFLTLKQRLKEIDNANS